MYVYCIMYMYVTPVQPVTQVGGTVQIKQLIVVPDRVLCTSYFWTDGSKYGSTESTILWSVSLQFPLYVILIGRDVSVYVTGVG